MAALIEMLTTPFVALFTFVRRLWTRWTWERHLNGLRKTDDERVYPEQTLDGLTDDPNVKVSCTSVFPIPEGYRCRPPKAGPSRTVLFSREQAEEIGHGEDWDAMMERFSWKDRDLSEGELEQYSDVKAHTFKVTAEFRATPELYAVPSDETTQRSARDVAPATEGEALDYVERRKL